MSGIVNCSRSAAALCAGARDADRTHQERALAAGSADPERVRYRRRVQRQPGHGAQGDRHARRRRPVVRRQGKGTYVVEHTPADMLFRFFQLYADDGTAAQTGEPRIGGAPHRGIGDGGRRPRRSTSQPATPASSASSACASTVRMPLVHETIVLPEALFPGLADQPTVPNTLYDLFQRQYGRMVARADERIAPVLGSGPIARALGVDRGYAAAPRSTASPTASTTNASNGASVFVTCRTGTTSCG